MIRVSDDLDESWEVWLVYRENPHSCKCCLGFSTINFEILWFLLKI
jgi:hypothetical protein